MRLVAAPLLALAILRGAHGAALVLFVAAVLTDFLDGPVARVCSAEVPIPYPRHLEMAATPQPDKIAAAAREVLRR